MRLIAFVTDAFGARGGIAKFNRDLLSAIASYPRCDEIIAIPRHMPNEPESVPKGVRLVRESIGGKAAFLRESARLIATSKFDGVICGHLNLLPVAVIAAARRGVPLMLVGHGIEIWNPPRRQLAKGLLRRVDALVTVSNFTLKRVQEWSGFPTPRARVIPNSVDTSQFSPGPRPTGLEARYGVKQKKVLLTVGRHWSTERYKGVDEVLDILPRLAQEIPDIVYIVVGEGDDLPRLRSKVAQLGVADRVIFAGYVPESEMASYYRLADAYVMPGRGEGFGIVYLEALACGVPSIGSSADASSEVLGDIPLGGVVDPAKPEELIQEIRRALAVTRREAPDALEYFSFDRFRGRWHSTIAEIFEAGRVVEPRLQESQG